MGRLYDDTWNSAESKEVSLPGGVTDYFYPFEPMTYDAADPRAYFGYKVLGVSYAGTLSLYGAKGGLFGDAADSNSGSSWARLNKTTSTAATQDCPRSRRRLAAG